MGIPGLFEHTGKLERISLAKLAATHFGQYGRRIRIAIDASIWLFQARASQGGANPELRTLYFRLLRLLRLGIDPVFVFDGAGRPVEKRNKRIAPGWQSPRVSQVRGLLDVFGFVHHRAPGEAEAECAFLQREGVVDVVWSEDGDTLMFGSTVTIRNWSSEERRGAKTPTHVDILYAQKIRAEKRLSREGMILIALMSGGDYDTVGIKGCGSLTAYEAAKAGFGNDLCHISQTAPEGVGEWRERLQHELKANESGFFKTKHPKLASTIDANFPSTRILESYLWPLDSSLGDITTLKNALSARRNVDILGLRSLVADRFEWSTRSGALKLIRGLAPALLTNELLNHSEGKHGPSGLLSVCGARTHHTSDGIPELRVEIRPIEFVPIDLDSEPLTRQTEETSTPSHVELDRESEEDHDQLEIEDQNTESSALDKRRQFRPFIPTQPERHYIAEAFVRHGAPSHLVAWEEASRQPKPKSPRKPKAKPKATLVNSGMKEGAIRNFFQVQKSASDRPIPSQSQSSQKQGVRAFTKRSKVALDASSISAPRTASKKTAAASESVMTESVTPWTVAKSAGRANNLVRPASGSVEMSQTIHSSFDDSFEIPDVGDLLAPAAGSHAGADTHFDDAIWNSEHTRGGAVRHRPEKLTHPVGSEGIPLPRTSQEQIPPEKMHKQPQNPSGQRCTKSTSVRVRESLPGSHAIESPGGTGRVGTVYRNVEIVDLTGSTWAVGGE